MILLGFVIGIGVLVGGVLISGGTALWVFDIPSIMLNIGFTAAALFAGGLLKDFFRGWSYLFGGGADASPRDVESAALAFDLAFKACLATGVIGTIMGLIMMMVNMMDRTQMGPYLAVAVITTLYALLLSFTLFLPGRNRLQKIAASL